MAKRKPKPKPQPKPAVAAILGLAEDAFIALETAQTWHSAIEYLKAKIASNRKMAAAQEAKANRRLSQPQYPRKYANDETDWENHQSKRGHDGNSA